MRRKKADELSTSAQTARAQLNRLVVDIMQILMGEGTGAFQFLYVPVTGVTEGHSVRPWEGDAQCRWGEAMVQRFSMLSDLYE